jgi:prepilin-type N-terminal cleavage/methylation domain-containing protein
MTIRQGAARQRRPLSVPGGRSSRPGSGDAGFTLIELVVVLVVVGSLLLVAVPSFLTARHATQDRAAQADLRHAVEAANTAYIDTPDFGQFSAATLAAVESALQFSDNPVSSRGSIAVFGAQCPDGAGCVALAEPADNGTCWYVLQANDGPPLYGKSTTGAGGACDAKDPANLGADFPA